MLLDRFRDLLAEVLPRNRFYARKYPHLRPDEIRSLDDVLRVPPTCKAELVADQLQYPPYGSILTYPLDHYTRLHQTSGTSSGKPLRRLDTPQSWQGLLKCWHDGFDLMGLTTREVVYFPFSFGPFLGFWTAYEAASQRGFLCIAAGGMSSTARLRFLMEHHATVVCCTPTYALHLAEVAERDGVALAESSVHSLIVAGEPGGAIAATRNRIETLWGARVFDHYGMTEVGPVAFEAEDDRNGPVVLDTHYLVEVIDPETGLPSKENEVGELIVTNLDNTAWPLIRYRTGDLVRLTTQNTPRRMLASGILGRTDDMIHLRGNNVYPSTIESVVRRFPDVAEFRIVVDASEALNDLRIEIEPISGTNGEALADAVGQAIRDELLFRVETIAVPAGTLPRFEMKARRIHKLGTG